MTLTPITTRALAFVLPAAAGLVVVALVLAQANEPASVASTASIDDRPALADELTTGSIGKSLPDSAAVETASVEPPVPAAVVPSAAAKDKAPAIVADRGSDAFREALALVVGGEHAAAHALARGLADDTERRTVQWAAIYYGGGAIDHESVIGFSADAPAFSDTSVFRTRLEQALTRADAAGADIIRILGGATPNTVDARIALALAYVEDGQRERAARIARDLWTTRPLARGEEDKLLNRLGDLLTADDHWDRAVYLMMHDRASGVERLMQHFDEAQRSLAVARNAVSRNAKNAKALLDAVDASLTDHPVFLFSRAQRARQFELWEDAVAWLNRAGGEPPEAAEWWHERRLLARQLIARREFKLAYDAVAGFEEGPEGRLVEARFHAGWIAFSFLADPATALTHFEQMREISTLPDSVAQSLYWAARAKRALGDTPGANEAFADAARNGKTYYGLLARAALGIGGVDLHGPPEWRQGEAEFEATEVVQAVRLLSRNGQSAKALPLLRSFALGLDEGSQLLLAARLARELGAHDLAIQIADTADRRGTPLDPFNFPSEAMPNTTLAEVDLAAVYAVARQESRFRVDAVSSAGARGLMQLMPATAKETAEKIGVEYSPSRLTSDGAYNALLGSTYLAAQLQRFDGSLVLAAAAYNAGAGNAQRWIAAYGDPREEIVDPVVWVELIPFEETRKYVQRVLANYLVYRARLGRDDITMSEALRRIE